MRRRGGKLQGGLGDPGLGLPRLCAQWPQPDLDSDEQELGGPAVAQRQHHTDFLGNHRELEREKYLPQSIPRAITALHLAYILSDFRCA